MIKTQVMHHFGKRHRYSLHFRIELLVIPRAVLGYDSITRFMLKKAYLIAH